MEWTHPICTQCWYDRNGSNRKPVRIINMDSGPKLCCFCLRLTLSGIYVRHNPEWLRCKGHWVSCPDMPDGLLTVDDETPQKTPKEMKEVE